MDNSFYLHTVFSSGTNARVKPSNMFRLPNDAIAIPVNYDG